MFVKTYLIKYVHFVDVSNAPQPTSIYNFVKLSFRGGFTNDVPSILCDLLQKKSWEVAKSNIVLNTAKPQLPQIKLRSGIVGIERSLQEKQKATDESINVAFQDLDKLMTMAKDMVRLSRTISTKIKVTMKSTFCWLISGLKLYKICYVKLILTIFFKAHSIIFIEILRSLKNSNVINLNFKGGNLSKITFPRNSKMTYKQFIDNQRIFHKCSIQLCKY